MDRSRTRAVESGRVVLMDLAMPNMNGFDATARIRSDWRTAATVIIALTAHSCPELLARALRDGCDHAFVKPCDLSHLSDTIRGRLAARGGHDPLGARAGLSHMCPMLVSAQPPGEMEKVTQRNLGHVGQTRSYERPRTCLGGL